MSIVQFVTSNVLSKIINFLANAVLEIFPGLGYVADATGPIINQLIDVIPAVVTLIETVVTTFVNSIDGLVGLIENGAGDMVNVIGTALNDIRRLGDTVSAKVRLLVSKAASTFDGATAELNLAINSMSIDATNLLLDGSSALATAASVLPSTILYAMSTGTKDGAKVLVSTVSDLSAIITTVVNTIESVIDTLANTVGSQITMASNEVILATNNAKDECLKLLAAAKTDLIGTTKSCGGLSAETARIADDLRIETKKSMDAAKNAAVSTLNDMIAAAHTGEQVLKTLTYNIEHGAHYISIGLVIGTIIICVIMWFRRK
jgi:phage-related protein